jgi:hypothetical protein
MRHADQHASSSAKENLAMEEHVTSSKEDCDEGQRKRPDRTGLVMMLV